MKDEVQTWLDYSKENLKSAKVLLASDLFNPCRKNTQQSVDPAKLEIFTNTGQPIPKIHPGFRLISTRKYSQNVLCVINYPEMS